MPDFEDSREMSAAPQEVWRLVSDPPRLAEWVPTATSSRPAGSDAEMARGLWEALDRIDQLTKT